MRLTPTRETSTAASSAAANKSTNKTKLPKLTGRNIFIRAVCASQRPSLGKVMADSSLAMFKTDCEIRSRHKTLAHFQGNYVDKHDVHDNGIRRTNLFIHGSLRVKQPRTTPKMSRKTAAVPLQQ